MKKNIFLLLIILIIFNLVSCSNDKRGQEHQEELVYEEIEKEIIRFHVIANSDSKEDQDLKLKVRDAVVEFVYNELKNSTSIEESRQFITNNKESIEAIAKRVVEDNGYDYKIESVLSRENFPDKVYGDVIFPQGEYEAYRILIGNGAGQNWWCVMFPPLCFVDGTKEAIDSKKIVDNLEDKSGKKLQVKDKNEDLKESDDKIVFKFKIFEGLKLLFK